MSDPMEYADTATAVDPPRPTRGARSHMPTAPAGPEAFVLPRSRSGRLTDPGFRDPALETIAKKLARGERLDRTDGLAMLATPDVNGLATLADRRKTELWGDQVFFVFNRQINPTNACVLDCKFCDYALRPSNPDHYAMTIDDILGRITPELREIHIVSGLHHRWKFEYYVDIIRQIRLAFPKIQIKAWTAVEIDFFAKISKKSIEEVFEILIDAGLNSMPGGGAEVFSERVRQELFRHKIGADEWLNVHRIAHQMGIPTNSTILYGHIETMEERVDHMLRLRELEDEAPGFLAFIPLEFQLGYSNLRERSASAVDGLRTVAAARLLLDNIPHIKAYWVMLGEETASIALNFGASDMDGTILEEKIAHAAKAESPIGVARDRLLHLIWEAGKLPVERDAVYNVVRRYPKES
ncbi:MAG: aminofutalosine synthase MqnE [Candidatus Eisenbacteria bacterium]